MSSFVVDRFFNYKFGELEYKTTKFEHKKINDDNYQGIAMMNYTDVDVEFTRVIEHKHFENSNSPSTWVTWEYPTEYKASETEPYYPVNDNENNIKYQKYKYYDMHQVIESALNFIKKEINKI